MSLPQVKVSLKNQCTMSSQSVALHTILNLALIFTICAGSRYVIDTNTGDVTIDTVRATDMANYSCTATNIVGVATAVLEVLVRGELHFCDYCFPFFLSFS